MEMDKDAHELQREWRAIVLAKLDSLEKGQDRIKEELVYLKIHSVQSEEHLKLEARVRKLEDTKVKALGAWIVIQGIGVAIAWLIPLLLKH